MSSCKKPSRKNPSPRNSSGKKKYNESPEARERRLAAARAYQTAHRKQYAINTANWRARKVKEDPTYLERRREYDRNRSREKRYGISTADYERMLARQRGRCALCRRKQEHTRIPKRSLSVDHSHVTGKIRALLCNNCNVMLGFAGDDANVLVRGLILLLQHGGKRPMRRLINTLNRLVANASSARSAKSKPPGGVSLRRRRNSSRGARG
jgi:Recombination endonuclease VII